MLLLTRVITVGTLVHGRVRAGTRACSSVKNENRIVYSLVVFGKKRDCHGANESIERIGIRERSPVRIAYTYWHTLSVNVCTWQYVTLIRFNCIKDGKKPRPRAGADVIKRIIFQLRCLLLLLTKRQLNYTQALSNARVNISAVLVSQ